MKLGGIQSDFLVTVSLSCLESMLEEFRIRRPRPLCRMFSLELSMVFSRVEI